jgi:hypothetical protein
MNITTAREDLADDVAIACKSTLFNYDPADWDALIMRQMAIVTGEDLESMQAFLENSRNLTSYGQI